MRAVTGAQNHISIFISHCADENDEARRWERTLSKAGFQVLQFGHALLPGERISTVADQIEKCNFFLLLVSDLSEESDWVQRELGLALETQEKNDGYRPIIIPLYSRAWSRDTSESSCFATRAFHSGEPRGEFPIGKIRGIDIYRNRADTDKVLLDMMTPTVLVSRLDFSDPSVFSEMDVFNLYEKMFPDKVERDPPEDIVDWVLHRDVGELRRVRLSEGTEITYRLDSRFFVLVMAKRAIGLAFFTYDFTNRIVYGNYMAVQECWRSGGIAREFARRIDEVLRDLYPDYLGTVFEVEVLDEGNIDRVLGGLETRGNKQFECEEDRQQMRRFLRISVYQGQIGCWFFMSKNSRKPLVCRSPCLDVLEVPIDGWKENEEDYWLMWYDRPDCPLDRGKVSDAWVKSVQSIRIEILAKSVIDAFPEVAEQYWAHANGVVTQNLLDTEAEGVYLGKFLHRRGWDYFQRWHRLQMPIAI